jgi:hypothetical protein
MGVGAAHPTRGFITMTTHQKAARDYTIDLMERVLACYARQATPYSKWEYDRIQAFKAELKKRRKAMA